jgi:hypothetical protein
LYLKKGDWQIHSLEKTISVEPPKIKFTLIGTKKILLPGKFSSQNRLKTVKT